MSELIAEARVLVVPDTTTFRPLLASQLGQIMSTVPPVSVPVAPAVPSGAAASTAAAGEAIKKTAVEARAAAAAESLLAQASTRLAAAEQQVLVAATQAGAARTRFTAATRAATLIEQAYNKALQSGDDELIERIELEQSLASIRQRGALATLRAAQATAAETAALRANASAAAASNVAAAETTAADAIRGATAARDQATRSTAAYTRQLSGLSSGAASSALSLVGLRGATLAATGPFLAGAAGAIALGKALSLATSFNSEIAVLGATTGVTGAELERASAAAREFGRDITLPGVSAGDAAVTITAFAKAGLDLNESLAATRGGLQLAQAAQIGYAEAVELTANSLNAFNLSGTQAVRVADTLANAANLSQGSITDVALALRQSAGAAQVVGVSFQDTIALLTQLAQNGLTGSDAGTALRTSFIRLVNPSKQARQVLQDLNVQLRDAQGNVRPEIFQEFAAAQRELTVAQQQANAAIVFGQDAFRVIGILGQEAPGSLDRVRAGLDQTGTAAKIAQARMTGLRGASENLSNQLSALGLVAGETATGPLAAVVNKLAEVVAAGGLAVGVVKQLVDELNQISPVSLTEDEGFIGDFGQKALEIATFGLPQATRILADALGVGGEEAADAAAKMGADIRSGVEDAGREAARGARGFQSEVVSAFQQGFDQINEAIRAGAASTRAAIAQSIAGSQGQAAGLSEQFDQIVAGGGSQQAQLANLRRQAAVQARIIENAGPDAAGAILEARREAQRRLAAINQQIVSIEEQIAADRKSAQDEAARIAEQSAREADQAFLQRQENQRTRAEQQVTVAEATPQLADDIRRQTQLRALLQQQIQALRQSAVDERTKSEAIRALRAAVFATTQEIKGLKQAQKEQRAEQQQAAQEQIAENLSLRTQIAEARGNDDAIVAALDAEIANAKKTQARAKKGTQEWLRATLALEQLKKQRRDLLKEMEEDTGGGKSLATFLTENAELFERTASNIGTPGVDPLSGFDFSKSIVATTQRLQQAAKDQTGTTRTAPDSRIPDAIDRLIAALDANTAATQGNTSTSGGMNKYATVTGQRAQAMADFWQAQQARNMEQARFDGGGGV